MRGWILVISLSVVASAPARAERLAAVVRGAGAGSDKAAAFVAHFVREALQRDQRFEVVDLADTLGTPGGESAAKVYESVDEAVRKGREAYESLDLDAAVDHLSGALSRLERNAAVVDDMKRVAEVLMMLGAAHILRGEDKTGTKRLAQAIALHPRSEPDPRVFNPGMRQMFQETARKVASRPGGALALSSSPAYAEVYVDGIFVGVTPAAIENIPEGRHFVRLVKDGYQPWGRLVEVASGNETAETGTLRTTTGFDDFDAVVDEAVGSVSKRVRDPAAELSDTVDQLGAMLNIDLIFFAEVHLDGERVAVAAGLYDLNGARLAESGTQSFIYDSRPDTYRREVDELVARHFSAKNDGSGAGLGGVAHVSSGVCLGMSCDRFKVMVFAGGAGGGAVLAGIGAIFWGLAKSSHNEFLTTPQVSEDSERLARSGKVKALTGDILVGVGAGLAIGGTLHYLLWTPSPSARQLSATPGDGAPAVTVVPTPRGAHLGVGWRFAP